jgi:hypothetical protein
LVALTLPAETLAVAPMLPVTSRSSSVPTFVMLACVASRTAPRIFVKVPVAPLTLPVVTLPEKLPVGLFNWVVTTLVNEQELNILRSLDDIKYENHTSKRVTGLVVSFVVKNGFGNVLHMATLQEDIAIEPGAKTDDESDWYWSDNPFIKGEPFDKMWQAAYNNTAKVEIKILKAVFEDGTILKANTSQQIKKKK